MDILRLLPQFWLQNKPTSNAWDKVLRAAFRKHGLVLVDDHEAKVGPFTIWVSNYPYAFGNDRRDPLGRLPRVWTRILLRRAIERAQVAEYARITWADY
jgi:hypothetical protein